MILSYQECIDKYGSDYKIKKEVAEGTLFFREKGIYCTTPDLSEIDVIMHKYPKAVCTGKSAYYYHSLTDVIPDYYYLATKRTDTRIKDSRVKQSFLNTNIFEAGITEIDYHNSTIRIYNVERMLIELIRLKAKMAKDYYKEIIRNYRGIVFEMDFGLVEEYAAMFGNGARLMDTIELEVL